MNGLLYMEIDLAKIKANIEEIRQATNKDVIPVIKSNAYSMGAVPIAQYLEEIGIGYAAVVDALEAKTLSDAGISLNLLILNSLRPDEFLEADKHQNWIFSVNSLADAGMLSEYPFLKPHRVHLQVDTGMNRLGFRNLADYREALGILKNSSLAIEGIYTHFTGPDNRIAQERLFREYTDLFPYKMIHCAATSTYHDCRCGNYVRVGLNIYGDIRQNGRQCLKVACRPLAIFTLKKGETIGYDQDYTAREDILVAVLPIGYYNGFRRSLRGFPVSVNQKRYETIGKVCMNHLFVKVDSGVTMESEFVITDENLPLAKMADYLHTIPHEILCMMNISEKRYKR